MIDIREQDAVNVKLRFLSKIDKTEGCWLWTASTSRRGYGKINIGGTLVAAHRLSWVIKNGSIPDGMCVCHKCDTPACVNPDHLFLGTTKDNMGDARRKHRIRCGSDIPWAKLTPDKVAQAKRMVESGVMQKDVAKMMGVSKSAINSARMGKSWRGLW